MEGKAIRATASQVRKTDAVMKRVLIIDRKTNNVKTTIVVYKKGWSDARVAKSVAVAKRTVIRLRKARHGVLRATQTRTLRSRVSAFFRKSKSLLGISATAVCW
jgi:hypothetical protein